MSDVRRFDVVTQGMPAHLFDSADGKFVLSADYDRLRAELTEQTRVAEALRVDAERFIAVVAIAFDDESPVTVAAESLPEPKTKDEFIANIDAAIAASKGEV